MTDNDKGRRDGRGILRGDYLNEDRTLTRQDWLEEVFPEWSTLDASFTTHLHQDHCDI